MLLLGLALLLTAPPAAAVDEPTFPSFASSVQRIDAALKERMVDSWRPGCPVPRWKLRYVTVSYVSFRGEARQGELVVHRRVAQEIVQVFARLYDIRFPIHRMRLVDDYQGDDTASMDADNTSAFNCRVTTNGSSWSEHSYGKAIDINPVRNPYVDRNSVQPLAGERFLDRSVRRKGMVTRKVRRAFAAVDWSWGGDWDRLKDYQHFSASGR
jgi:poly-gamma-glutamate synthesis protein (capsule biosynthesis protein)